MPFRPFVQVIAFSLCLVPTVPQLAQADPLPSMWEADRQTYRKLQVAACDGDRGAYKKLEAAAERDRNAAAMNWFRITLYVKECGYGDGDTDRTRKLLVDAAEAGYPIAQSNLGVSYLKGENGFPRDPSKGVALMERAARGGYGVAAGYLAKEYIDGTSLEQDLERAESLIGVAREEGVDGDRIARYETALGQARAVERAAAEKEPVFAALVISEPDAAFGWAYDQGDREAAVKTATAECKDRSGRSCKPVLVLEGRGCAGYSYASGGTPYGWGVNRDRGAAQSRAAQECRARNGGASCDGGDGWVCNTRSERDLNVVYEAENTSGDAVPSTSSRVCQMQLMQYCENWFGGRVAGSVHESIIVSDFRHTVSFENCGDDDYAQSIGMSKGKWSRGNDWVRGMTDQHKSMFWDLLHEHRRNVQAVYPECRDHGTKALVFPPGSDWPRGKKRFCTTSLEEVRSNGEDGFMRLCLE